jgi:hypothetical protein
MIENTIAIVAPTMRIVDVSNEGVFPSALANELGGQLKLLCAGEVEHAVILIAALPSVGHASRAAKSTSD